MLARGLKIFSLSLFLTGCSATKMPNIAGMVESFDPPKSIQQRLLSLSEPYITQGKRTGVGCSGIHAKGKSAQRTLAKQRAIDEIAMQKNTSVSNTRSSSTHYSGGVRKGSRTTQNSEQSSNVSNLKTTLIKELEDRDRLCVLMVEE